MNERTNGTKKKEKEMEKRNISSSSVGRRRFSSRESSTSNAKRRVQMDASAYPLILPPPSAPFARFGPPKRCMPHLFVHLPFVVSLDVCCPTRTRARARVRRFASERNVRASERARIFCCGSSPTIKLLFLKMLCFLVVR